MIEGKKIPTESVILATVEKGSRRTLDKAMREMSPLVASQVPRGRTGSLEHALEPRIQKTPTGHALVVGPRRGARHASGPTIAQVVRYVTRGTGLRREGPGAKFPIHSPRWLFGASMTLPGGKQRLTVKGQRPNPFLERLRRLGTPRIERAFREGANDTAKAVARKIAG